MKRTILLCLMAVSASISTKAQSVGPAALNAAGGTTTIGSKEFDWSIGEMTMISTISTSGIIVTQGVLQPADVTLGIATSSPLSDDLQVFPNPATSVVNLRYTSLSGGSLTYSLLDITGKVISNSKTDIKQGTTSQQIDLSGLAAATYMLNVIINSGGNTPESKSFKIDKLK